MKTVLTYWLRRIQNFDKLDQQVHIDNMQEYISKIGQKQLTRQNKDYLNEDTASFQENLEAQFRKVDISDQNNIIYSKFLQQFGYSVKYQVNVDFEALTIRELKKFSKMFFCKKNQFVNLEFKKQIERAIIHNRVMKNLTYVIDYSDLNTFTDTAEYDLILNGNYRLDMSRYNKYIIKLLYISNMEILRIALMHPKQLTTVFLNKVIGFSFDPYTNLETVIISDMELQDTTFYQALKQMAKLKNIEVKYSSGVSELFLHIKGQVQYISVIGCQLQNEVKIGDVYRTLRFLRVQNIGNGILVINSPLLQLEVLVSKPQLSIKNSKWIKKVQFMELLSEKQTNNIQVGALKHLKYFKSVIIQPQIFSVKRNNITQIKDTRFNFVRHLIYGRDFINITPLQNYPDYILLIQNLIHELNNSQRLYLINYQYKIQSILLEKTINTYRQELYGSEDI